MKNKQLHKIFSLALAFILLVGGLSLVVSAAPVHVTTLPDFLIN